MPKTESKKQTPQKTSIPLWGSAGDRKQETGATCWKREQLIQGTDASKMGMTENALNKQLNITVSLHSVLTCKMLKTVWKQAIPPKTVSHSLFTVIVMFISVVCTP